MTAPNILGLLAADPNIDPALRAVLAPKQFDNWVLFNHLGQRVSVVYATSGDEAIRRYWEGMPEATPTDWTARVIDYSDSVDCALSRAAAAPYGRCD